MQVCFVTKPFEVNNDVPHVKLIYFQMKMSYYSYYNFLVVKFLTRFMWWNYHIIHEVSDNFMYYILHEASDKLR